MKSLENLSLEEYEGLCRTTNLAELKALEEIFQGLKDVKETCDLDITMKNTEISKFTDYLDYAKEFLFDYKRTDMEYEIEIDETKGLVVILEFVNSKHTLILKNI